MKKAICILILSTFLAAPAVAGLYPTVLVAYKGVDPSNQAVAINSSGYDGSVYAGIYRLEIQGATYTYNGYLDDGVIDSFCIDIWDTNPDGDLTDGDVLYDIMPLDETPDGGAGPMGDLRARYLADMLDKNWTADMTATQKVALQLAVWEVVDELQLVYDNPTATQLPLTAFDVKAGSFHVEEYGAPEAVITEATKMLASISEGGADYMSRYRALSNSTTDPKTGLGTYQDYVVKVPIPAAVLLGFLGLGAAGLKLRKFA